MSVNNSIDPRFLYHVEDESLSFRDGESAPISRQGFCGNRLDKDETDGDDDEDNVSVRRHGALVQPGIGSVAPETNRESKNSDGKPKRDFASVDKERVTSVSSWDSLKAILSDPVTGSLMNDATILPCGHSFGAGGLKEVKRLKACFTCSQPTSEGSEKPNLSLRIVVHAFRQEEESDHIHSLKRRKESTREVYVSQTSQKLQRVAEAYSFLSPLEIILS